MPKTFVLTDESLNNYGFWLPIAGADLDQFKKNPIMLWMHKRSSQYEMNSNEILPIGFWENIRVNGDKLLADAVFDENDEFAMRISDKVEHGTLRMASAGIKVIETSTDPKQLKPGQTRETPTKWRLREASIVDIGANDNAMALAFYDDNDELINLADGKVSMPLRKISEIVTNTNDMSDIKKLAKALALSDDATPDQVEKAIEELTERNQKLEKEKGTAETNLAAYLKKDKEEKAARATTLIDAAIKDGRVEASSRESWVKLFASDFEFASTCIETISRRKSAKEQLGGAAEADASERASLEKLSWDELDRAGKLAKMVEKFPDLYEQKFESKFGCKPKK